MDNLDQDVLDKIASLEFTKCFYCNDTGRTKEDAFNCKHCGRSYQAPPGELSIQQTAVPRTYVNRTFNLNSTRQLLGQRISQRTRLLDVCKSFEDLDILLQRLQKRDLARSSIYISGEKYILDEVRLWAYTMMRQAELQGFRTSPIMFLNEVDIDSPEGLAITNSDLLFIYISNYKLNYHLEKLDFILPKRESLSLPTIALSPIPLRYLRKLLNYDSISFDIDLYLNTLPGLTSNS